MDGLGKQPNEPNSPVTRPLPPVLRHPAGCRNGRAPVELGGEREYPASTEKEDKQKSDIQKNYKEHVKVFDGK